MSNGILVFLTSSNSYCRMSFFCSVHVLVKYGWTCLTHQDVYGDDFVIASHNMHFLIYPVCIVALDRWLFCTVKMLSGSTKRSFNRWFTSLSISSLAGIDGRNNARDVDLNRNFPDQFFVTKINRHQQPETLAVMKWMRSVPFVLSANLHGGAVVANYPFDDNPRGDAGSSISPDNALFIQLAKSYSNAHTTMHTG